MFHLCKEVEQVARPPPPPTPSPMSNAAPVPAETTCYTIGKRHFTRRANANESGVSEFEWVADAYYGLYPTNLAAKRAYMEVWKPEAVGWPDQMVKAHFNAIARNEKSVKILTIKA